VVDEVQGHTNDTQANVSEENMHGDRNPENIILTQKSKLMVIVWCEQDNPLKDSHIMVLEIQRISIRFMGKKSSQYLPVHNDYTNQPFHLPHPPPPCCVLIDICYNYKSQLDGFVYNQLNLFVL
jgi:hypothetical protein